MYSNKNKWADNLPLSSGLRSKQFLKKNDGNNKNVENPPLNILLKSTAEKKELELKFDIEMRVWVC